MSGRKNPVPGVFLAFIGGAVTIFGARFGIQWLILAGVLTLVAAGLLLIRATSGNRSGPVGRSTGDTPYFGWTSKNDGGGDGGGD
ncbi:hypothetical protein [Aestuariicoccus sp. MJ-SS9]|uniref:hypothetical protein n=1 Tax=Aestuariicoccus sp. MJ-SS9 TaxID=3079855 RepID=UPI00290942BC|nr:hypothetical protein [Aestuariicoccus sp. MJ-SS9]MDU8910845.1 hypothetical protein [Aestuariicoccus sp. MJ-SS9]